MPAVRDAPVTPSRRHFEASVMAPRAAALAVAISLAAITSQAEDWQPLSLVVALGGLMVVADAVAIQARKIRLSSGLTVLVPIMALLGPAPAVAIGLVSTLVESLVNHVRAPAALTNLVIFAWIALVGGVLFDVLGSAFELGRDDGAYALLVPPVYLLVATLDIVLVVAANPGLAVADRRRVFRESALPTLPWELVSCVLATAAVFAWAHAGLAAVAGLLALLLLTLPLLRNLGFVLKSGDDLLALRRVSDQRAAEVARLASDRERLLSEVLDAERRERAHLAESLHDGPMQRLLALRQDVAGSPDGLADRLDTAIAETRAIISSFHPATVRELGFEASIRAAAAPFQIGRPVEITVRSAIDDRLLADTLLLPVAQELVVNAVKHAHPTTIEVSVLAAEGGVVLEVGDDGEGIDVARSGEAVKEGHVGLAVVRRRVEDAGGHFEIATRSDGGTRSRVRVPGL